MYPSSGHRPDYKDVVIRINGESRSLRVCKYFLTCSIPPNPGSPGFEARCLTAASPSSERPLCPSWDQCQAATYSQETEELLASEAMLNNNAAYADANQTPFSEPVQ